MTSGRPSSLSYTSLGAPRPPLSWYTRNADTLSGSANGSPSLSNASSLSIMGRSPVTRFVRLELRSRCGRTDRPKHFDPVSLPLYLESATPVSRHDRRKNAFDEADLCC